MEEAAVQISRLCLHGRIREALAAFRSCPLPLPASAYSALLHACARHRLLPDGRALHRHLLASTAAVPDLYVSNHLVNMYCKCRDLDAARQVFDGMPERNLVSWTALVSGYGQSGRHEECFGLFASMVRDHVPNDFALSGVLSSCAEAGAGARGRQVHSLALKIGYGADVYVGNALISMYSRCFGGNDSHGDDDDVWCLFRGMVCRNSVTWNSMIAGVLGNGRWDCALDLFACMLREGIKIDRATLVSMLPACSSMEWCHTFHCVAIKTGLSLDAAVATSLVQAYSGLEGSADDCYRIFLEATRRDVMSWNVIIASCAERDPEKAISFFCQLRIDGLDPDMYTLSIIVKACAGLATERHGSALHSFILRSGFGIDPVLSNALIHAYARCGSIELAKTVFERMEGHDIVSWNTMIRGYAMHGRAQEALRLFQLMDVPPDSTTFVALLTACSHAGLVEKGRNLFKLMSDVYGIAPQVDHYACMVDILGRVGLLSEAEEMINQMPMEPDSIVWSALLGACRKHKEVKMGERAAQKLMELQPQKSASYVNMSNIFSAAGSFNEAALIRTGMKKGQAKKEPGLSWIEIKNRIHEFAVGGHRHPQIELINAELKKLAHQLKKMGYVSDTSSVLHEVKEEDKEERLLQHSEKLALVFGLLNAFPAQPSVRIMKNIRTCLDCHNFMKIASKCIFKDIILRDANRFHHFKDGACSCGDYW